jgi:hypothetical protein
MKTGLILVVVAIVAAVAYFAFMPPASAPTMDGSPSIGMPAPGNEGNYPEPQAKLNIVEICQSALAYMSFPSGSEADAFVQACINGDHPEVIDRWKQDNGITDDRTI